MKVGWLADSFELRGGAELTQEEFRAAAPAGVEVVSCPARPARARSPDCDVVCIHNCVTLPGRDRRRPRGQAGAPLLARPRARRRSGRSGAPPLDARARDERLHLAAAPRPLPAPRRGRDPRDPSPDRPRALPLAGTSRGRAAPAGSARRCTPARASFRPSSGRRSTSPWTSGACSPELAPDSPRITRQGPRPARVRAEHPRALPALSLPADHGRAVRPRRGRGVGGGLRADRQPQRRRAALDRGAGRAPDRGG